MREPMSAILGYSNTTNLRLLQGKRTDIGRARMTHPGKIHSSFTARCAWHFDSLPCAIPTDLELFPALWHIGVVARLVPDVKFVLSGSRNPDLDAVEVATWNLVPRVVPDHVLGPQIVADTRERLVKTALFDVEVLATRLLRECNHGVLTADVAACAGLNRHVDNGVDHHFVPKRLFESIFIRRVLHGIATIGDQNQHLAALLAAQRLRPGVNRIVEGGAAGAAHAVETVFDLRDAVREPVRQFSDIGVELNYAHLVLRTDQGANKFLCCCLLDRTIFVGAGTCVDGKRKVERQLGLALEDRDLLRTAVFVDSEIILGETADQCAVLVSDVDKEAYKFHVEP